MEEMLEGSAGTLLGDAAFLKAPGISKAAPSAVTRAARCRALGAAGAAEPRMTAQLEAPRE